MSRTTFRGVKNDFRDASDLAVLLRMGRLPEAWIAPHLAARLRQLQTDGLAGQVTNRAIDYLNQLFAAGPNAIGSLMAGRAETGVGDPEVVSASVAALSEDLVRSLGR